MNRFDEAAETWDKRTINVQSSHESVKDLKNNVKLKENACILDYGCGTGFIAFELKNETNTVYGMDYSQGMVDVFNKKVKDFNLTKIQAIKHNIIKEELEENKFDLIITSKTMHHIKDTKMFFEKTYNSLKKDGILCINDLDKEDGSFHKDINNEGVYHMGYKKEELLSLAKHLNFEVISYKLVYNQKKHENIYPLFNLILKK